MKAIMKSIKPKQLASILNGDATLLICKQFPKDYQGWVYLYCTFPKKQHELLDKDLVSGKWKLWYGTYTPKNGKVVARFWCDKVDKYDKLWYPMICSLDYTKEDLKDDIIKNGIPKCRDEELKEIDEYFDLLRDSCLDREKLRKYATSSPKNIYAIHISKLEIFDEPRELSEFRHDCSCWLEDHNMCKRSSCKYFYTDYEEYGCFKIESRAELTKAPQNFCYIESEE